MVAEQCSTEKEEEEEIFKRRTSEPIVICGRERLKKRKQTAAPWGPRIGESRSLSGYILANVLAFFHIAFCQRTSAAHGNVSSGRISKFLPCRNRLISLHLASFRLALVGVDGAEYGSCQVGPLVTVLDL